MISDYYVNLHFNQAIAQRTGYAFKIGDKGCTFHFHCEDLNPSGMFPHIVFNHPNNTCVEGVPTGSGRDYAYTIQGNEFAVIGKTVVDLKFYDALDATQRISTASFIIEILPDTYTPFEEASSSYADSLERAREEIDAAILELQGAEHDLEEAETDLDNMSGQFADTLQDYIDAFGNTAPINPRGEYDPAEQYVPRDAVQYTAGGKTLTYINRSACTGIAPTDPDHGAEHWQIMIDVSVGGSFSALSDVSVDPQTLADGQVPVYDATGQVWENKTILENSLTSTATDKALTAAKGKELQDNKLDKTLETALTIDGTTQTTVEGALGGLNDYGNALADNLAANENVFGAKNLGIPLEDMSSLKLSASNNSDGSLTVTTNGLMCGGVNSNWSSSFILKKGTYQVSFGLDTDETPSLTGFAVILKVFSNSYWLCTSGDSAASRKITLAADTEVVWGLYCESGTVVATQTVYPMIRPASIIDPTFVPYAKTNLQLTNDKAERNDLSTIHATGSTNTTGAQIDAGKFFYLNGQFCKALTNIAVNATFTLNTNFKADSVGGELNSLYPTYIGDCLGSDATLNNLIQNYCSSLPLGLHLANIEDNYGTSVLGGGSKVLLILKGSNSYYAIMAYGYAATSADTPIYKGSFHAGTFKGFVRISPIST